MALPRMGASGTASSTSFVEIPGEGSLAKTTGIPPIRVRLPLEAEMRAGPFWFFIWTWYALFGLVMMFVAVATAVANPTAILGVFAVLPVGLIGFFIVANTVFFYSDLAQTLPQIVVANGGFWDRRAMDHPIGWPDISRASVIASRYDYYSGILLTLRRPAIARRNPFRFGAAMNLFRRRRNEVIVPVSYFRNRRELVMVTLALVKRHGGETRP